MPLMSKAREPNQASQRGSLNCRSASAIALRTIQIKSVNTSGTSMGRPTIRSASKASPPTSQFAASLLPTVMEHPYAAVGASSDSHEPRDKDAIGDEESACLQVKGHQAST